MCAIPAFTAAVCIARLGQVIDSHIHAVLSVDLSRQISIPAFFMILLYDRGTATRFFRKTIFWMPQNRRNANLVVSKHDVFIVLGPWNYSSGCNFDFWCVTINNQFSGKVWCSWSEEPQKNWRWTFIVERLVCTNYADPAQRFTTADDDLSVDRWIMICSRCAGSILEVFFHWQLNTRLFGWLEILNTGSRHYPAHYLDNSSLK